ncbi:hypothetical protein ALI22I_30700 [Saccharothrix sp. ALI-22-I]|uniref:hypothetical protein n=1 Tax=Saccharothrix sp. ALI-22-I TaxID=1933778 RepID=UPI00097C6BE5|nr:hypothetical protein [Saccharothrix sp. ALI-22-I]ONI84852.1 hypothetical protein ALI22I_30700 [Saccharothrix sp. ALI-22-I]
MRYAPPGSLLDGFTVLRRGAHYHLVHAQRALDHGDRAGFTSFGHAVSTDLVSWETRGPCFGVAGPGAFDSAAIRGPHVFGLGVQTAMLYTGLADGRRTEGTGLAFTASGDGSGWLRVSADPVVRPDPRWYGVNDWRDPFLVDGDAERWAMVVGATGRDSRAGVIGLAVSDDLVEWEVRPPLEPPGDLDGLGGPVVERTPDGWLLLAVVGRPRRIEAWAAPELGGPWEPCGPIAPEGCHAPRLVRDADGAMLLLHTVSRRGGSTDGVLAQPKVLDTTGGRPRLRWWCGTEDHLSGQTRTGPTDGLLGIGCDGPGEVVLRADGPSLTWTEGARRISFGDRKVVLDEPAAELRVLAVGDYVEVYADDVFVLSAVDHSARCPPKSGRRPHPVRALLPIGPPRDDALAVTPSSLWTIADT